MVSRGAYCLCITVGEEVVVEVGALGRLAFTPGHYIYVGSALRGLETRVRRHLNTSRGALTAVHWHIDYFLKEPAVSIDAVYTRSSNERVECEIAASISRRGDPLKGFGCSDCRCESHLFKVKDCRFLLELGLEQQRVSDFIKVDEMLG